MSSDALDPTRGDVWRRRLIVGLLFALGASVAIGFTLACVALMNPNLLPHHRP